MVRMTAGLYAGEVRKLPNRAAENAIRNGTAQAIVDVIEQPATPVAPIVSGIRDFGSGTPAILHGLVEVVPSRSEHHKRPGRRR